MNEPKEPTYTRTQIILVTFLGVTFGGLIDGAFHLSGDDRLYAFLAIGSLAGAAYYTIVIADRLAFLMFLRRPEPHVTRAKPAEPALATLTTTEHGFALGVSSDGALGVEVVDPSGRVLSAPTLIPPLASAQFALRILHGNGRAGAALAGRLFAQFRASLSPVARVELDHEAGFERIQEGSRLS